jgi:uncharacterized membrane protein YphA (DoxX/SURF4 family)
MLFCLPVATTQILGLDWSGKLISPLWDAMVVWVGKHVLAISGPIPTADNGSGDRLGNWIFLLCIAVISLVAALVWAIADRRRPRDAQLRELLRITVRYTLAFVILGYGVDKLFLGQFPPPNVNRLIQPYGESSPMGLMWTFMGASPVYQFFSGAMEVLGALLLLFRRTTTLGALVLGAVLTNIVLMNFCYDVPVKINSSHYLGMCGFLLLPEIRRLTDVLVRHRPTQPALRALVLPRRWMRVARRVLKYGLLTVVVVLSAKQVMGYRDIPPGAWYEGYWNVTAFTRDGQDVPPLVTDATRWKRIRFQVAGTRRYVRWRGMDDSYGDLYGFTIDETARTIVFVPDPDRLGGPPKHPTGPFTLTYTRTEEGQVQLDGKIGADNLQVRLKHLDPTGMLLVSRGFHWVNEVPFNR